MPQQQDDQVAAVLLTEQRVFAASQALKPDEAVGHGKALLVRPTEVPLAARVSVQLDRIVTDQDWRDYEQRRVPVEHSFGIGEPEARCMVRKLRERSFRIGLDLYRARDGGQVVGAVGYFRLSALNRSWGRLQEVDVFPGWRGRGYGDALLAAVFTLLAAEGCTMVVVGADEDDWRWPGIDVGAFTTWPASPSNPEAASRPRRRSTHLGVPTPPCRTRS